MRLTNYYSQLRSENITFFDIDIYQDTKLYLDPNRLVITDMKYGRLITGFFEHTLSLLRSRSYDVAIDLWKKLGEPNETCLGMSEKNKHNKIYGKGIGEEKATWLLNEIRTSKAMVSGLITDLKDVSLFIHGVGPDNISDIATDIVKELLIEYTLRECKKYKIDTRQYRMKVLTSSMVRKEKTFSLPFKPNGKPLIFVPKSFLSSSDRFSNGRIYGEYVLSDDKNNFNDYSFLIDERVNGERYITKKKLKRYHKEVEYRGNSGKDIVIDKLSKKPSLYQKAKKGEIALYRWELKEFGGSKKVMNPKRKKSKN